MRWRPNLVKVGDPSLPTFKESMKVKRAAKAHYKNFADLESTKYAESMDRSHGHNYQIRPVYHEGMSMKLQNSWMNGEFDESSRYPYKEYADMILDAR